MRVRAHDLLLLLPPLLVASGCEPVQQAEGIRPETAVRLTGPFNPVVDLRADVNRNGTVDLDDPTEDEGEDTWSAERGAIFLANIDDDQELCAFTLSANAISDDALAYCHDALDSEVNGEDDLADLARLRTVPWPEAPDHAVGVVSVAGAAARKVRLFKKTAYGFAASPAGPRVSVSVAELRRGVELAIEATTIVRNPADWDGYADVTFSVSRSDIPEQATRDTVRMRVAPVVLFHHLTPAKDVFVSRIPSEWASTRFRTDLRGALKEPGSTAALTELTVDDLWTQDYFEPAYMAMPKPGGQHVIRVNLRSANVFEPDSVNGPLRNAGRIVFWLRGPDRAAVQQYQRGMSYESQTLNSFGNTEVIPPYEKDGVKYPLGRVLRGRGPASRPDFQPDPSFTRMLEAQAVQPPVYVDTSWLWVAHVDETLSFLPADTPRGWIALVADPALARRMLLDAQARGYGDTKLFTGLTWGLDRPAETTLSQVLDNPGIMNTSAMAAAEIDTQLSVLREETGLTDAEIVRVPFLFQEVVGGANAYQPGTVNLLAVSRTLVIAPDPHGPIIDGKDLFKVHLEEALAPYGIRVSWLDAWDPFHIGGGEVHCATHSAREIPQTKWWEAGR